MGPPIHESDEMRSTLILAVLALGAVALGPCFAQSVYKWTDADGVVHFGDRQPVDEDSERVEIQPPPPAPDPPADDAAAEQAGDAEAKPSQRQRLRVLMYGRTDCGYCAKARRYFARRGIRYRELDVADSDSRAYAEWKKLGGTGVPLFVINGKVARGFSDAGMDKRLAAYGW